MKIKLITVFLSLLYISIVSAKTDTTEEINLNRNIGIQIGNSSVTLLDRIMSPNVYRRLIIPSISALYQKEKSNIYQLYRATLSYGKLRPQDYPSNNSSLTYTKAYINYYYGVKFKVNKSNWNFFLGPEINLQTNLREHSKLDIYGDFVTSIAPSFFTHKKFQIKQAKYLFSLKSYLPIVNILLTPGYGYMPPDGYLIQNPNYFEGFTKSLKLFTLPNYLKLNNQFNFIKYIKNENAVIFSWEWELYTYNKPDLHIQGSNNLYIGLLINF